MNQADRKALAAELEDRLRPLIDEDPFKGGYNCCGCSTYEAILDDAIAVVLGTYEPRKR